MWLRKRLIQKLTGSARIIQGCRHVFGSEVLANNALFKELNLTLARRANRKRPYGNLKLHIETTSACNAECIFCHRQSLLEPASIMKMSLFERIIEDVMRLGIKTVVMSGLGEPLIDPLFVERCRLLDKTGTRFTFFTNGSLMTRETAEKLLSLDNFKRIYFSVNGYTANVYERIMVGLQREQTYKNILRFLALKDQFNRNDIEVTIHLVLLYCSNHETDDFYSFWKRQKGVSSIYFAGLRDRAGMTIGAMPENPNVNLSPMVRERNRHPCKFLWEDLHIYVDGRVAPCHEDAVARRIILGNVNNSSLKDIWTGDEITKLRELHMNGMRIHHPVCGRKCKYNPIWLDLGHN
jgi:radical SAM protein with 4Fe4S-binding SPASM domain